MRRDKIESIDIKKFRKLKDIKFNLGERLTIISGHNGIGKSTILGLIANASEFKEQSLLNKQFKSRFSEIFKLDIHFDYEKPKENREEYNTLINYTWNNSKIVKQCKISKHNDAGKERLKIVPRTIYSDLEHLSKSTAKVAIPTLYLGLSRLIPIGETTDDNLGFINKQKPDPEVLNYYNQCYNKVMDYESNESFVELKVKDSLKHTLLLANKEHKENAISSGQDSLSSIITALSSFYSLKKNNPDNYFGGILLIDEIDITLHPVAQKKLVKLLNTQCRQLNLQIIATTHSLTILKEVLQLKTDSEKSILNAPLHEVCYISGFKKPILRSEISYEHLKNDLFSASQSQKSYPEIKLYTEDAEAKFILDKIIKQKNNNISKNFILKTIALNTDCRNLITLPEKDNYFKTVIIVPDGDTGKGNTSDLQDTIEHSKNIIKLIGDNSPEENIHDLLSKLVESPDDHDKYYENYSDKLNETRISEILSDLDDKLCQVNKDNKKREAYKNWFRTIENEIDFSGFMDYYIEYNKDEVELFIKLLNEALSDAARLNVMLKLN